MRLTRPLAGSGDAWTVCAVGHRHWGRHGAAGLLVTAEPSGVTGPPGSGGNALGVRRVLLQLRAPWSHHGSTWGLPGGALHAGESAAAGAVREAGEETGLPASAVLVHDEYVADCGGWTYTTVLASLRSALDDVALLPTAESTAVDWVAEADVANRPLHPAFGRAWPVLRSLLH